MADQSTVRISNLAELHFYDSSGEALHGVPIGPDTTFYRNLTDHDPASNKAIRKWFGYDFGHPVSVSEIVYLNFNDGENICVGHEYELCYFDEGQWQTAGVTTATDHVIEFNRVPSSALFQVKKTEPETETVACLLMKMEKSDFGKTERYEKKDNYTSLVSDRL